MPLTAHVGALGQQRAAHLLRRATFAPSVADINTVASMDVSTAMAYLFQDNLPVVPAPLDEYGVDWSAPGYNGESDEVGYDTAFRAWLVGQMIGNEVDPAFKASYSAREKITFFYHVHFTTMVEKVGDIKAVYYQNQLFRMFAFDSGLNAVTSALPMNFKDLLKKVCVDNAMLVFLDGNLNVEGSPNENYAREMFELYAIGRGLENTLPPATEPGDYIHYKESDVQAAARVLSGFQIDDTFLTIDEDTMLPMGRPRGGDNASAHDFDVKTFSERFDDTTLTPDLALPTGRETALDEIDQMVEMIFSKREAAKFICRKLYRFFSYYKISEAIDLDIIEGMADTFEINYSIQEVLEQLFSSAHFYEGLAGNTDDKFGSIIKSPLDLVCHSMGYLNLVLPDYTTETLDYYNKLDNMLRQMELMGMTLYQPLEVAGYPAYHQFPIYNRNWISTNYLTRRYELIQVIIGMGDDDESMFDVDITAFIANNYNAVASDAKSLITAIVQDVYPMSNALTFDAAADDSSDLTAERLNYFLQAFLFDPQIDADPEAAWTFRWNNPVDPEVVNSQLSNLLNAILQTPEFQLF